MTQQDGNQLKQRAASFRYAFDGWRHVLATQPNAWIHGIATLAVLALALWLNLPRLESAVLILAIALVWTAELINTAVEAVVDLTSKEIRPLARIAKDVAAGAVLVSAAGAAAVGLLLLGPPLWMRLVG